MATKSTTKGKSSRKKQSTSKRGRPTKKEQKRNRVNRLWSIVFFAVGCYNRNGLCRGAVLSFRQKCCLECSVSGYFLGR